MPRVDFASGPHPTKTAIVAASVSEQSSSPLGYKNDSFDPESDSQALESAAKLIAEDRERATLAFLLEVWSVGCSRVYSERLLKNRKFDSSSLNFSSGKLDVFRALAASAAVTQANEDESYLLALVSEMRVEDDCDVEHSNVDFVALSAALRKKESSDEDSLVSTLRVVIRS